MVVSQKYVWHLATGGMTHMLRYLGGSIKLCRSSGRKLIANTKQHVGFCLELSDIFNISESSVLTSQLDDISEALSIWRPIDSRFPTSLLALKTEWHRDTKGVSYYTIRGIPDLNGDPYYLRNFVEEQDVVVTYGHLSGNVLLESLCELRLEKKCVDRAYQLHEMLPLNYIGGHFRNTDYQTDYEKFIEFIVDAANKTSCVDIFIATDDIAGIPRLRESLKEYRLHFNNEVKIDVKAINHKNLHYIPEAKLLEMGSSKWQQHANFFADIFCLSKANVFVANPHSGVRSLVGYFRLFPELLSWFYPMEINSKNFLLLEKSRRAKDENQLIAKGFQN
jgi:hypothetical protein